MTDPDALSAVLRGAAVHLDGSLVYALDGELDLAAASALCRRVEQLAPVPGDAPVVLDLSRLGFIDCAGVRAICQLDEALRRVSGSGLVISGGQPPVRKVFDLLGINERVKILAEPSGAHNGMRHNREP
jgi:anti-anti-sigma factor